MERRSITQGIHAGSKGAVIFSAVLSIAVLATASLGLSLTQVSSGELRLKQHQLRNCLGNGNYRGQYMRNASNVHDKRVARTSESRAF